MANIQNTVIKHGIVDIIDRNPDILIRGVGTCTVFLGVYNLTGKNTCDFLLQYLICGNLQICVNGQGHIPSGHRLCALCHLYSLAHIVYDHLFAALGALEHTFHIGLDTAFSYHITDIIPVPVSSGSGIRFI